jgi:hypothetical protein
MEWWIAGDVHMKSNAFVRIALGLGAGLFCAVMPALANPAACDAIQNGFNAVASVPGYRQVVELGRTGERMEGVVIGETVYMRINDRWTRMRLKAGGRKGMLNQILALSSITDCREVRSEALPSGVRAKVYEYMMTPPRGLPGASDKPVRTLIWIGIEDGLVHRQVSEDTSIHLAYDRVVPPIP